MELIKEFMGQVITIDGPAASGKTSVSRELAKRLGWSWVSTGAFYRGLAFVAQELQTDLNDENALSLLALDRAIWQVQMQDEQTVVLFKGRDVTPEILREDVGTIASKISQFPKVRSSLLGAQRKCADLTEGLVAEGRDCGTVVFPGAEVKVYLTATQQNRAERRAKEQGLSTEQTVEDQRMRDQQDSNRKVAPMQAPKEALVIDSTDLNFDQVVGKIEQFVKNKI